jgi:hypothetical protein
MNYEHMQPAYIWGGVENEVATPGMKKMQKIVPLFLYLAVIVLFLPHSAIGQQVSFTLSKDTIHTFDDLTINNTSVDLPPGTGFRWEVSGTNFLNKDSMSYYQDSTSSIITFIENATQFIVKPGFPTTFPSDTLRFTLVAIDSNGIPLAIPDFGNNILLFYVTPIYQCADQVNDPCINFVCNPSFENLTPNPFNLGPMELYKAIPWTGPDAEVFSAWSSNAFGVPQNMFGSQMPKTSGNLGYAGFHPNWTNHNQLSLSEIISTPLKFNLNPSQSYKVTFWASLSNRSNLATELTAYIDIEPQTVTIIDGLNLFGAITWNPAGVVQNAVGHITDMHQWVEVTGSFTPQTPGAYRLYIGAPDPLDVIVPPQPGNWGLPGPTSHLAYYYIDDVEVVPMPAKVTVEGSPIYINGCLYYDMSAIDPENVKRYEWSINGVVQPNSNVATITLPSNGISIELTVYNYHDCPTTYTFPVDPHCLKYHPTDPSKDIILENLSASDLINNYTNGNPSWSTSDPINILGTLTIDTDFGFYNCDDIVMGRDAKIVVNPNVTFVIGNSNVYSCLNECFFWDGIYATHAPPTRVTLYNNTIKHAKNVVYSRNNPILNIQNNLFEDNMVGIHITNHQRDCTPPLHPGDPIPTPIPASVTITNNTFKAELHGKYMNIYDFLPGFNGMEWGVIVDTVDLLTIGPGNTFRELACGIHINYGNVDIQSNSFELIKHYVDNTHMDYPFGHISNALFKEGAIVVNKKLPSGSTLPAPMPSWYCVPELIKVENNDFEDCRLGVYAWNVPIEIIDNTFVNTTHNALRCHQLISAVVSDNSHSWTSATDAHTDNVFNYEYYIGQIHRRQQGYNIDIKNNEINTFKSGINLVQATSSGGQYAQRLVQIRDNTIYLDNIGTSPMKHGLRLQGCDRARVFKNTIANIDAVQIPSPQNPLDGLHGIHVSNTRDAQVYENYTIKGFGKGIYNIGQNTGTQFHCNTLDGNYDGFYCPPNTAGSFTWVSAQLVTGEENQNCFENVIHRRVNNQNPSYSIPWYYIGSFDPNNCRAPVNSVGVDPLPGQGALLACAPLPAQWMNPTTRLELFGFIEREGDTLYAALPDEFEWYADEYLYRSFLWDNGWMYLGVSDDSVYQHYFNFFENEAIMAFAEIEELIGMGDLEQALWANDHVVTQTLIEFNQQLVNGIYLETWAQGLEPDAYQTTLLEAVALLTPFVGGNAVFSARVMLDIDPFNYGLPYRMAQETPISQPLQVVFYPNPARNTLVLEFIEPIEGAGTFEMFDVQGRKVLERHLNESQSHHWLDTSHLKDGLYIARLRLSNGEFVAQKIVIKH